VNCERLSEGGEYDGYRTYCNKTAASEAFRVRLYSQRNTIESSSPIVLTPHLPKLPFLNSAANLKVDRFVRHRLLLRVLERRLSRLNHLSMDVRNQTAGQDGSG
jgi:hypothetical protein